jgi:hypothetical protein
MGEYGLGAGLSLLMIQQVDLDWAGLKQVDLDWAGLKQVDLDWAGLIRSIGLGRFRMDSYGLGGGLSRFSRISRSIGTGGRALALNGFSRSIDWAGQYGSVWVVWAGGRSVWVGLGWGQVGMGRSGSVWTWARSKGR